MTIKKSPNLSLSLPRCRHCSRYWRTSQGVVANASYCKKCSKERRSLVTEALGLKPIEPAEVIGRYLLPRRLRTH